MVSSVFLTLAAVFFLATNTTAQTYKAEIFKSPAPEELAASVRDTLASEAVRVIGPQGPLCEMWWRKAVPAQASATQELGVAYGQLAEGTLVGAIRFLAPTTDYRSQKIKAGVYTLRYALIPVDGNHQGVSPNRDFLLISPAGADPSPALVSRVDLLNMSRKASGTGHPSVWSLLSVDSAPGSLPALKHQEDGDTWVLYFRAQVQPEKGAPSSLTMALLVVGHAAEG